jgi:hypothetical protein
MDYRTRIARGLRTIIFNAPPEADAEILSAGLPDLPLPVNEPGIN